MLARNVEKHYLCNVKTKLSTHLKAFTIMKEQVFIAVIVSNNDGNVEATTKPFSSLDKAGEYLHKEYLDIKAENECEEGHYLDYDEVENFFEDTENDVYRTSHFYMEETSAHYSCWGDVYGQFIDD
jgi:hypothetical protein